MADLRNRLAKERDKYMADSKVVFEDQYEKNRIESAFIAGWKALEEAIKEVTK